MTAYALVTGTLFRPAGQRVSKNGKPFVTATIRATHSWGCRERDAEPYSLRLIEALRAARASLVAYCTA
jgi:hypothetical protein